MPFHKNLGWKRCCQTPFEQPRLGLPGGASFAQCPLFRFAQRPLFQAMAFRFNCCSSLISTHFLPCHLILSKAGEKLTSDSRAENTWKATRNSSEDIQAGRLDSTVFKLTPRHRRRAGASGCVCSRETGRSRHPHQISRQAQEEQALAAGLLSLSEILGSSPDGGSRGSTFPGGNQLQLMGDWKRCWVSAAHRNRKGLG